MRDYKLYLKDIISAYVKVFRSKYRRFLKIERNHHELVCPASKSN